MAAEANLDVAIACLIASEPGSTGLDIRDPSGVNDLTAAFVADDPSHRIGFSSVHPDVPDGPRAARARLGRSRTEGHQARAELPGLEPLSDNAQRVYRWAEEHGQPILFHQGTSPIRPAPFRYAHPLVMDEIAIRFPELRIVMAHIGHPWQADTVTVIRKHPHVYADVSANCYRPWSFYSAMRIATEWNVLPKLLLGIRLSDRDQRRDDRRAAAR